MNNTTATEYVTKEEAIKDLLYCQDPDLIYVSQDEINWEYRFKCDDPLKSDWTGAEYNFSWLDNESIVEAVDKLCKEDQTLLNKLIANIA